MEPLTAPDELAALGRPLVATTPVPRCVVCGAVATRQFAAGFDYELLTCANEWRFVQCRNCGHVWLDPRPDVEALSVIYPPTYYAYHYDEISKLARWGKALLDSWKVKKLLRSCGAPPAAYLDVGCGDGRYLMAVRERGAGRCRVVGLELDERVVAKLNESGLEAYCERIETCERFEPKSFDLISMFHVIEHVDDPSAVIGRLTKWLRPGGVLALETPNLDSLDAKWFRDGRWGGYHFPRHWHLFTPRTLKRLLASHGLEVVSTSFQTGHSFWLYSLHHTLRYRRPPRKKLAMRFDPLRSVMALAAVTVFDKVRAALGAETSAMLVLARSADR